MDHMLEARHEGHHHTANVPYGYAMVAISVLYLTVYSTCNIFDRKFRRRFGRSLVPPWWVLSIVWLGTLVAFTLAHGALESLNAFAKRAGRITYAAVPLTVFLSLHPSPVPAVSYLHLWNLHKWVGRSVVAVGTAHGVSYIVYFVRAGEPGKIFHFLNFLGVLILVAMLLMLVTSLPWVRRRSYRLFYGVHVVAAWFGVLATILHARPGVWFLAGLSLLAMGGQAVYAAIGRRRVKIEAVPVTRRLSYVSLPRFALPEYVPVGAHVRLVPASSTWFDALKGAVRPTHPFTVASLASDDHVKLVVRTSRLPVLDGNDFVVTGPYDSRASLELPRLRARKTLVVAGGSGISLGAAVARSCLERGETVHLVWATRDRADVKLLKLLDVEAAVTVYITGATTTESTDYSDIMAGSASNPENDIEGDAFEIDELLHENNLDGDTYAIESDNDNDDDDDDDLTDNDKNRDDLSTPTETSGTAVTPSGSDSTIGDGTIKDSSSYDLRYGRPVISQQAKEFFGEASGPETLVVACGPVRLVEDVESWARSHNVQFTGDVFEISSSIGITRWIRSLARRS